MKRRHASHLLLALACALPALAHALDDGQPLSMVFEPAPQPAAVDGPAGFVAGPARLLAGRCTLFLPGIEDRRLNKADAGNLTAMLPTVHATPLSVQSARSGDARAWVRDALLATRAYGFEPVQGARPDPAAPARGQATVEVALRLAHAWSASLNLVSHVVLQATWRLPDGTLAVRQYHGMGTRTNFASGNGEFMAVLNAGLEIAVRNLAGDAVPLCEGRALPPVPAP